ncbi:ring-cleaving dioxygenase [soil metagenome]
MAEILGIHHMSAISGAAQENINFYSGVLGLRLVKVTVNFDDPTAYHFYYGDGIGTPGTVLTFFPYPAGYPGRPGKHQATVTALTIPRESVSFWVDRLKHNEIEFDKPHNREGGQYIGLRAPDGLQLELSAYGDYEPSVPTFNSFIPQNFAIGQIRAVTLVESELEPTARFLVDILGFQSLGERDHRHRFQMGAAIFDVIIDEKAPEGRGGHGSVHHIALRVRTEEEQLEYRNRLIEAGVQVSAVMDRTYFKSIYFKEPGGVLFEIATDGPGFTVDETADELGSSLKLPPQFEDFRLKIARQLPPVDLRKGK